MLPLEGGSLDLHISAIPGFIAPLIVVHLREKSSSSRIWYSSVMISECQSSGTFRVQAPGIVLHGVYAFRLYPAGNRFRFSITKP